MNLKTWTIISLLTLISACSRMVKEEPYLTASSSKTLSAANDSDMPNTNNNLDIPVVDEAHDGVPNDRPPAMAFAKKRSQSEDIVITDLNGKPTIEIYNQTSPWELMIADFGQHWTLLDEDPENCVVKLNYSDPIATEIKEEGFFKRVFTTRSRYEDQSGNYHLNCIIENSRHLITLTTPAGEAPSSHVVDDLFAHIFENATKE